MTIKKTYKLFIGGKFPRTESGRVLEVRGKNGELLANVSRASRKDFRECVVAARKAQGGWAKSSAYLKGQILYRIAEVLDGRRSQFEAELSAGGWTPARAKSELTKSIDLLVHYAGWSDKFQSVFSTVNPVASSHFNFSVPEASGVVAIVSPSDGSLSGLISALAPVIVGGNSAIVLATPNSLSAITFAEVLATSDVPGGVVNILTGHRDELISEFAKHMDVNSVLLCSDDTSEKKIADLESAENLKRVVHQKDAPLKESPYHILDFQEIKTTWHPIGV
ncbi:aldehyde dehydrogenase family protein [Akkermansiaceae bacterium]|nr:aldehyde dehydrogenase family protein [Akkermansiaceae bacterium]MDB4422011.1 aldehyde dehydrogenase family protein [Akkermansiaceae bacterium]MDB4577971.1 aldehyde dehydrogenase family protein [Akkermansiaceae bacterium]